MKFLYLVWCNLKRKKLRTSLTLLSVAVAFLLFGLLCTIRAAFTSGVTMANADRLITRHKVSLILTMPASYRKRIEQVPGVDYVCGFTWFNGIYQNQPKNFFATLPVDIDTFFRMFPEYYVPDAQMEKWKTTRGGAVVGKLLAERLGWKVGDRVPLVSPIWPNKSGGAWEFDIVGIYDSDKKVADKTGFFFRYDYFDEGRIQGGGEVGWYYVRVKDPQQADRVAAAVDREFANSPRETKTEPEGAFAQGFVEQIGSIGTIVMAILSAVFFTILLVAGNTMAQSVRERTQEIGVLKALGFSSLRVLMMVLAESCMIALLGGAAGLLIAWLITLGGSPVPQFLPVFFLPLDNIALGAALALALGVLAGILPAFQAMRLRVAVALRRQA